MPNVLTILGYEIYFWLNEGKPLEPIHVHVSKQCHKNATKIWINSDGTCQIENNNDRIPNKDLRRILKVIETYNKYIEKQWESKFGQITYHDKIKNDKQSLREPQDNSKSRVRSLFRK